jgi:hypothetical protein
MPGLLGRQEGRARIVVWKERVNVSIIEAPFLRQRSDQNRSLDSSLDAEEDDDCKGEGIY